MQHAMLLLVLCFVEVLGCHCKDMEDDRSLYTNHVGIFFKGTKPLKVQRIEIELESKIKPKEIITSIIIEENGKKKAGNALDNLKNIRWSINLHPNDKRITIRFFYGPDAKHNSTSKKKSDKIVIDYHKTDVLLSPECGIKEVYIIDKVTTTFESSAILVPDGKVIDPSNKTCHVEISY